MCFGSDAETCPYENLYRIIGVFNDNNEYRIKLIKADYSTIDDLGTNGDYSGKITDFVAERDILYYYKGQEDVNNMAIYDWNRVNYYLATQNARSANLWDYSELNKTNLNDFFVQNLGYDSSKWIDTTSWQVGIVVTGFMEYTTKEIFDKEFSSNETIQHDAKVGLIYVSDYKYALSSSYWNMTETEIREQYETFYHNINNNNWLDLGLPEWLITRYSDGIAVFGTYYLGHLVPQGVWGAQTAVRPCFYLKSNVAYESGDGSLENPYRLSV